MEQEKLIRGIKKNREGRIYRDIVYDTSSIEKNPHINRLQYCNDILLFEIADFL